MPSTTRPCTTTSDGSPAASAANPANNSSRSAATTAARCSNCARVVAAENATSTSDRSGRSARNDRSRSACARTAAGPRADTSTGTTAGGTGAAPAAAGSAGSGAGASSRITCELVPLTPNDDTPARRGRSAAGHSRASVSSETAPDSQSTCGDGASTCSVGGRTCCRSAITILITPAMPAAVELWPMFDLIDPSHSGPPVRSRPYVASSAWASIGSPSLVPVPCPSTTSTSDGARPALASAARITRSCEGPLGAVSPLLAPSWLTALPRSTASTVCPLRRASDSRSSTTSPRPSEKPVPSAAAAYALQRPSGDSARCRLNSTNRNGPERTVTPPTRASEHSPDRSARAARCRATSEEEQAVSTDTDGPSSPRVYEIRPDTTLEVEPVSRKPSICGRLPAGPTA